MRISHCPPAPRRDDENARRTVRPAALWVGLVVTLSLAAASCAHSIDPPSLLPGTWRVTVAAPSWAPPLGPGTPVGLVAGGDRSLYLAGANPIPRTEAERKGVGRVGNALESMGKACTQGCDLALALIPGFPMLVLAVAVPAALVDTGVALFQAPSTAAVGSAAAVLPQAWEAVQAGAVLQDQLVARAREAGGARLVPLPAPELPPSGAALQGAGSGPAAPETILVVWGPRTYLRSTEGAEAPNPRLTVVLTVRILLLRSADGAVLFDAFGEQCTEEARTFTAWGADNAAAFRTEVQRSLHILAGEIVMQALGAVAIPASVSEGG
jgi:hypothetical protein